MTKMWVAVSFPFQVEIDFDSGKEFDEVYIEQKRNEAKEKALNIAKDTGLHYSVIHDAELSQLIE